MFVGTMIKLESKTEKKISGICPNNRKLIANF